MPKFRKKPVVVEAWQYHGGNGDELILWGEGAIFTTKDGRALYVKTWEGQLEASRGDWIIKGVKGELYPCKPDIFAATYEPAEDGQEGS